MARPTSWFKRWLAARRWQQKAWDYKCEWDAHTPKGWTAASWNCDERRDAFRNIMEKAGLVLGVDFVNCITQVQYYDDENWKWITEQHVFWELWGTNKLGKKGEHVLNGYRIDPAAPSAQITMFWKGAYNERAV